jgi:hypothetical protein
MVVVMQKDVLLVVDSFVGKASMTVSKLYLSE